MDVEIHVRKKGRFRDETVVHFRWTTTAGNNEPRGTEEGRDREGWTWGNNGAGMVTNWHCWRVTDLRRVAWAL